MLATLEQHESLLRDEDLQRATHALLVLPGSEARILAQVPAAEFLQRALKRRGKTIEEVGKEPITLELSGGTLIAWVVLDRRHSSFKCQTIMRNALQLLLAERPEAITVGVFGNATQRRHAAELAAYCAWVNGIQLPQRKKKTKEKALRRITVYGFRAPDGFRMLRAQALGNALCRELTVLPPNELTPGVYRKTAKELAKKHRWGTRNMISRN